MKIERLNKTFKVKSGKFFEYDLEFNASGISKLDEYYSNMKKIETLDLEDKNFDFYFLDEKNINEIRFNIIKINHYKFAKFSQLPEKARKDGLLKIKRFITNLDNWEKK